MSQVILDPNTLGELMKATQKLELVDASGNVVGHFVPIVPDDANKEPKISEEELERREKLGGGRSLKDIMADLVKSS